MMTSQAPPPRARPQLMDLSRNAETVASLSDISPIIVSRAVGQLRQWFSDQGFEERLLNPFTDYPIDFDGETIDVANVGQLRFNTEPDIWAQTDLPERFYSITPLFRREQQINVLRRSCFTIVDFYQPGPPDLLLELFYRMIAALNSDAAGSLRNLPSQKAKYDPNADGPDVRDYDTRWVIATGYDPTHSFFEIDGEGNSTRAELFLIGGGGFLEVAALGIVGTNNNPQYTFRDAHNTPSPPPNISGMGFGLERLLLANQLLTR